MAVAVHMLVTVAVTAEIALIALVAIFMAAAVPGGIPAMGATAVREMVQAEHKSRVNPVQAVAAEAALGAAVEA
jgi:hypothetical protein